MIIQCCVPKLNFHLSLFLKKCIHILFITQCNSCHDQMDSCHTQDTHYGGWGSYPSAEVQSVYSTAPANRATD